MDEIELVWRWLTSPTGKYVLYMALAINLALTLLHLVLELKGYLWRYFGAIAGLRIPDALGFFSFFVVLLAVLWGAGWIAFAGPLEGVVFPQLTPSPKWAIFCMAAIIGGRISDSIFSHILLDRQGYRPNPALGTVPYYLAEAAYLILLFSPGLWNHYDYAAYGLIAGWLLFFSVLPLLRALRKWFTSWVREPWQRGESLPSWAREPIAKKILAS